MKAIWAKSSAARAMGAAVCFLLLCAFVSQLQADKEPSSAPSAGADQAQHAADLTLQLPIKAAPEESSQFIATVPGFALLTAKLHFHPGTARTRLMLGVRFASRAVQGARLEVALLDGCAEDSKTIHHFTHVESLGPVEARRKGNNLDWVRRWDSARALWFDVPVEAREAEALRVEVYLQREAAVGEP